MTRKIIIGVTGASGALYAQRFLECAIDKFDEIKLVYSETAIKVVRYELAPEREESKFSMLDYFNNDNPASGKVEVFKNKDLFAPLASGSSAPKDMVVVPCSMGTLGRIAAGLASSLIERTADVVLKEKGRLILCPRETPFNTIHLENLLRLDRAGAHIVPPSPGFYQHPKTREDLVDFVVGKLFEALRVEHDLYPAWQSQERP
jgi:4-hydroxy-3-polyprenylbenzoate decarboxylase